MKTLPKACTLSSYKKSQMELILWSASTDTLSRTICYTDDKLLYSDFIYLLLSSPRRKSISNIDIAAI